MDEKFEPYPVPPTVYFGQRWDAPLLDGDTVQIDVPLGKACMFCDEPITAEDRGLMRPAIRNVGGELVATQEPAHMECDLRAGLGSLAHVEGRCTCAGARRTEEFAGTDREEALAVLAHINRERAAAGMPPM
jgi:hypothetical protein